MIFEHHTGTKIHILFKNSHVQNHKMQEIQIFTIAFFIKITFQNRTFLRNHFSKSHFQNRTFSQKSLFRNQIFTRIAFPKYHFSQRSHFFKYQKSSELMDKKCDFAPLCYTYQTVQVFFDGAVEFAGKILANGGV